VAFYNNAPPVVIIGIESEGLYRVSGFHSDIEAIKLSLDKGEQVLACYYSFACLCFRL